MGKKGMRCVILYLHGKGGSAAKAERYRSLCAGGRRGGGRLPAEPMAILDGWLTETLTADWLLRKELYGILAEAACIFTGNRIY